MPDSTIDQLPLLSDPALGDYIACLDSSASNTVKRLLLAKMMELLHRSDPAFTTEGGEIKLLASLNGNGFKIAGIASGSEDDDAVKYSQVKPGFQSLAAVTPATPTISDRGAFLRVAVSSINNPWGGFYLFYWCVDTIASGTISLVGGVPTASSGATVYFDGSVSNVVNVIKDSGWVGKYFHVMVQYRNLSSISSGSGTGHLQLVSPGYADLINETAPEAVTESAMSIIDNRIYITANKASNLVVGVQYQLELLFDSDSSTVITGNEPGLVRMAGYEPSFTYDIPLSIGKYNYAHARILTANLMGSKSAGETVHGSLSLDGSIISDTLMNYVALRMAEKVVTQADEPLKFKA